MTGRRGCRRQDAPTTNRYDFAGYRLKHFQEQGVGNAAIDDMAAPTPGEGGHGCSIRSWGHAAIDHPLAIQLTAFRQG